MNAHNIQQHLIRQYSANELNPLIRIKPYLLRLLRVDLMKPVSMSVHTYLRPSVHKKFVRFEPSFYVQVEVDECYTTVCHMTRSKVKVKVAEVRKLQKWPISQYLCSSAKKLFRILTSSYLVPVTVQIPQ